jgi:hypothetical protein
MTSMTIKDVNSDARFEIMGTPLGIIQHRKVFCRFTIFYGDFDNFSTSFRIPQQVGLKRRKSC